MKERLLKFLRVVLFLCARFALRYKDEVSVGDLQKKSNTVKKAKKISKT